MILQVLTLLGALGLFMYGLNLLSGGLLKLCSDKFKTLLPWMCHSSVNRILSGIGISAITESSSAATVMIVSFVNAGALKLRNAIQMIMGVNIGASLTAWIIALCGFCLGITSYIYPFIALGFVFLMLKGQRKKTIGEIILGFSILFLGLGYMMKFFNAPGFPALESFLSGLGAHEYSSIAFYIVTGCVLAFFFQSTGAIAVTMIMLSCSWITFPMAAAMVLGENIGTTFSANFAASDATLSARRAALVHTFFNIGGVVIAFFFFHPFISLTEILFPAAWPNDGVLSVAMFHTLFNLFNTCILVWFSGPLERLVTIAVKRSNNAKDSSLIYISSGNFGTPSIAISQAFKEVVHFATIMYDGFGYIRNAINETDHDKFEVQKMKLVELEELSDKMEYKIAGFLNKVSMESISEEDAEKIKVLYRIIGEMESLGDSGENISRIMEREHAHNHKFDSSDLERLNKLIDKVDAAYSVMVDNLRKASDSKVTDISNAYNAEDEINDMRNSLREDCMGRIGKQTGNYQSLNYFLDIISELESMGDFMINISQAIVRSNS